MTKPPSRKAGIFHIKQRTPVDPTTPTKKPAHTKKPLPSAPVLHVPLYDSESEHVVGALLDAKRRAEELRAESESAGDLAQSLVFAQKSQVLSTIAARVALAITTRNK